MLILLPPSETKRDGGVDATALELGALSFSELTKPRAAALHSLKRLARNLTAATAALGLGPTQRFEVQRNREVMTSPLLPAIDRYTGVLYDALDAGSFTEAEGRFAADHLIIHSALFGLLRAVDPIPAYRLSHDSRLPGISLRRHWRDAIAAVLAAQTGLILDLRSESYVALGPAPVRPNSVYLRVVSETSGGRRKALTHFNKKGKGEFVRALVTAGIDHDCLDSLLAWAAAGGIRLAPAGDGQLDLVVQP